MRILIALLVSAVMALANPLIFLSGKPPTAAAAFTFVAGTGAASANSTNVTTGAIDTTGAKLMVIGVTRWAAGGVPAISDSKGNTWTALTGVVAGGDVGAQLYYCINGTVGTGHTFTGSASNSYPAIAVVCFSSTGIPTFDQEGTNSSTAPPSSLGLTGSITPAGNNYAFVTVLGSRATGTSQTITGFTIVHQNNYDGGGAHYSNGTAYQIQTTATATNPTWSWTPASNCAIAVATFAP